MIALLALFMQFLLPSATPAPPPMIAPIPTNVGVVVTGGEPSRQQIETNTYIGDNNMEIIENITGLHMLIIAQFVVICILAWRIHGSIPQELVIPFLDFMKAQAEKTTDPNDDKLMRAIERALGIDRSTAPNDDE